MSNFKPLSVNKLIQINSLSDDNGKLKATVKLDTGENVSITLLVEKNKKMIPASMKDYNTFLEMYAEKSLNDSELIKLKEEISLSIDKEVSAITVEMGKNPEKVVELSQKLNELLTKKPQIIEQRLELKKEEMKQLALQRNNWLAKGIFTIDKEDGSKFYSMEIPSPEKRVWNLNSYSTSNLVTSIDIINKDTNSIASIEDLIDPNVPKKLSTSIADITTKETVLKIFDIIDNVINKLEKQGVIKHNGYIKSEFVRLPFIKTNISELSYNIVKDIKSKYTDEGRIDSKDIKSLKDYYNKIKSHIKTHGYEDLKIYLNIQTEQSFIDNMCKKVYDTIFDSKKGLLTVISNDENEYDLSTIKAENIQGFLKIPSVKKGMEDKIPPRTTFFTNSQNGPLLTPISDFSNRGGGFGLSKIEKQFRTYNSQSLKNDINDIA